MFWEGDPTPEKFSVILDLYHNIVEYTTSPTGYVTDIYVGNKRTLVGGLFK